MATSNSLYVVYYNESGDNTFGKMYTHDIGEKSLL